MAQLQAHIDWTAKTVTFSGPGTFQAKEKIKSFGSAKWRGDIKSWIVSVPDISVSNLKTAFPQLEISESGKTDDSNVEPEVPSGVPSGVGVAQFIAQVRAALAAAFPAPVFIRGVISKIKAPRHTYIELSDSDDSGVHINCFIWSDDSSRIIGEVEKAGFALEPDLEVMFEVDVGINPRRGDISLTVRRVVVEYTIGKLAAERDKTNEQLKKEGIFNSNRSLDLAFLPTRLGLITSSAGTVINDFRNSLDQARYGFKLLWHPSAMQGTAAKREIVRAIKTLGKRKDLDAILIFRGGGSRAELAVFNDYEVAKAVCLCPLPIFSAIGHQEDLSSVQDVSFRACGVPKDLGRFFADIIVRVRSSVLDFAGDIAGCSEQLFADRSRSMAHSSALVLSQAKSLLTHKLVRLQALAASIPMLASSASATKRHRLVRAGSRILDLSAGSLDRAALYLQRYSRLPLFGENIFERAAERLAGLTALVDAVSPETQLKRGFSIVRKTAGRSIVIAASDLQANDQVELEFYDAKKSARIE